MVGKNTGMSLQKLIRLTLHHTFEINKFYFSVIISIIDNDKWRCKTCKFLNDNSEAKCTFWHEEKKVMVEKSVFGGASTKKRAEKAPAAQPKSINQKVLPSRFKSSFTVKSKIEWPTYKRSWGYDHRHAAAGCHGKWQVRYPSLNEEQVSFIKIIRIIAQSQERN